MSLQLLPLTQYSPLMWTAFLGAATLVVTLVITIAIAAGMRATSGNSGRSRPTPSRPRGARHDSHRWSELDGQEARALLVTSSPREAAASSRASSAATDASQESDGVSGSQVLPGPTAASAPTGHVERAVDGSTQQRPQRELAHRVGAGLEVTLLWSVVDNALTIRVIDHCVPTTFEMPVSPDRGSFAFHHPFAYAAENPQSGRQSVAHAA